MLHSFFFLGGGGGVEGVGGRWGLVWGFAGLPSRRRFGWARVWQAMHGCYVSHSRAGQRLGSFARGAVSDASPLGGARPRSSWRAARLILQMDIEDVDDAERALTLSNPVLESLEKVRRRAVAWAVGPLLSLAAVHRRVVPRARQREAHCLAVILL